MCCTIETQDELDNFIITYMCKQADLGYKYANYISGGKIDDCLKEKLKLSPLLLDMICDYDVSDIDNNCLDEDELKVVMDTIKDILGSCDCN